MGLLFYELLFLGMELSSFDNRLALNNLLRSVYSWNKVSYPVSKNSSLNFILGVVLTSKPLIFFLDMRRLLSLSVICLFLENVIN